MGVAGNGDMDAGDIDKLLGIKTRGRGREREVAVRDMGRRMVGRRRDSGKEES